MKLVSVSMIDKLAESEDLFIVEKRVNCDSVMKFHSLETHTKFNGSQICEVSFKTDMGYYQCIMLPYYRIPVYTRAEILEMKKKGIFKNLVYGNI